MVQWLGLTVRRSSIAQPLCCPLRMPHSARRFHGICAQNPDSGHRSSDVQQPTPVRGADLPNRDCPTHWLRREAEHAAVLVTEAWQCRVVRALPGLHDQSGARALRTSARHRSVFGDFHMSALICAANTISRKNRRPVVTGAEHDQCCDILGTARGLRGQRRPDRGNRIKQLAPRDSACASIAPLPQCYRAIHEIDRPRHPGRRFRSSRCAVLGSPQRPDVLPEILVSGECSALHHRASRQIITPREPGAQCSARRSSPAMMTGVSCPARIANGPDQVQCADFPVWHGGPLTIRLQRNAVLTTRPQVQPVLAGCECRIFDVQKLRKACGVRTRSHQRLSTCSTATSRPRSRDGSTWATRKVAGLGNHVAMCHETSLSVTIVTSCAHGPKRCA